MKLFVDSRDWLLAFSFDIDDDFCLEDQDFLFDSFIAIYINIDIIFNFLFIIDSINVRIYVIITSAIDKNYFFDNYKDQDIKFEVFIDNDIIFNVERFFKIRIRDGKVQYLVKWVGYLEFEVIWELVLYILDFRLIDDFYIFIDK